MDVLPSEAFRGAILRLLMLETGELSVTPQLIRRSLVYTTMFAEAEATTTAARGGADKKDDEDEVRGPWVALPIMSPEVVRRMYHPVNELSAGTLSCFSAASTGGEVEVLDLSTDWIARRNGIARGVDAQTQKDSDTRRKLWKLDSRFHVVSGEKDKKKSQSQSLLLVASKPINVLRVCGGEAVLIRLLGPQRAVADRASLYPGDKIALNDDRTVLVTSKIALERAIKHNTISALVRSASAAPCSSLTKGIVSDTRGNAACFKAWNSNSISPSVFDTLSAIAPNATSIRSALLSIGFGVRSVRERFIDSDTELRTLVEKNVHDREKVGKVAVKHAAKNASVATYSRPHQVSARKLLSTLLRSIRSEEFVADAAVVDVVVADKEAKPPKNKNKNPKTKKGGGGGGGGQDGYLSLHVPLDAHGSSPHGHGLEGWIRGRYEVAEDNSIPEQSMLQLAAMVLEKCSDGIAMHAYVRAPDWESFVEVAKASASRDDVDVANNRADLETESAYALWLSSFLRPPAELSQTNQQQQQRVLTDSEREWILVDEVVGTPLVLSISDHVAYKAMPMSAHDHADAHEHDPRVLQELVGAAALSAEQAKAVDQAARIMFDSQSQSLRRLNDVITEIQKKRDALFQKFKTNSVEARLIRRAEEEAEDAILVEKVQAIHGALRASPAWAAASRDVAETFMARAAQRLFRSKGVNPVQIPRADAMNRAVSAYAKHALATPEVAKLVATVTEFRFDANANANATPHLNINSLRNSSKNKPRREEVPGPIGLFGVRRKLKLKEEDDDEQGAKAEGAEGQSRSSVRIESAVLINVNDEAAAAAADVEGANGSIGKEAETAAALPVVEVTSATLSKLTPSDAHRAFLKKLLEGSNGDEDVDAERIVRGFLVGDAIPYLYRLAAPKKPHEKREKIDMELLRTGAAGRLHLVSVADSLRRSMSKSKSTNASASLQFFYACQRLLSSSGNSAASRLVVTEMVLRLRDRVEFNRTDAQAIKADEEAILRLRSRQQF